MTSFPPINWHELGIDTRGRTTGQVKTTCPKCSPGRRNKSEPCLSVNLSNNTWNCHHCGWSGPEKGYAKERGLTGTGSPGVGSPLTMAERERPKFYRKPEPPPRVPEQDRMMQFFHDRGISPDTVTALGIYQGEYTTKAGKHIPSICFPYYRDGELVNIKHRFPNKRFAMESGAELIFYNLDRVQGAETIIICEGENDVAALHEAGYTNVISPPNGAPSLETDIESAELEYMNSAQAVLSAARKVILAGDMDAPGKRFMDELARRIGRGKCWRVTWPEGCKDANDVLISDGFDGGASGIRAALDMAQPYPVDGITSPSDYLEELWRYEEDVEQGARMSMWPTFADKCRFSPGQLTIVTGVPSSGKSVFMNSIMLDLALTHGWNVGVFSPEYHPPSLHVRDLVENMMGKTMNRKWRGHPEIELASRDEVRAAVTRLSERVDFIMPPSPTLDAILERAQTLVFRRGIKMLIIDPWTEIDQSARGNMSIGDWIDLCLKRIRRFGREYGVHVVVVAHPRKMPVETDREGTRIHPVVTPYDISGSSHWFNMADIILSVWRDKSSGNNEVHVHIQKMRFSDNGEIGAVGFTYNFLNRRYTDLGRHFAETELELQT